MILDLTFLCVAQLITLVEDLSLAMNHQKQVDAILLEISPKRLTVYHTKKIYNTME